jgi:hypothetical protein
MRPDTAAARFASNNLDSVAARLQEWIDPYGGYTKKDWAARDVANTEYQQRRRK